MNDQWVHEHLEMVLAGIAVLWAFTVWLVRLMMRRYVTMDHLQACRDDVRQVDENLDREIRVGIHDLSMKIDRLDDRRREDAINNSSEHQKILHDMANWYNGVK